MYLHIFIYIMLCYAYTVYVYIYIYIYIYYVYVSVNSGFVMATKSNTNYIVRSITLHKLTNSVEESPP
jgi:hypothetical protein